MSASTTHRVPLALGLWLALASCGGDEPAGPRPGPSPDPTVGVDTGSSTTPTETTGSDTGTRLEPIQEDVCDAGDEVFVERAIELVLRRRPRGSTEVQAWAAAVRDSSRGEVVAAMAKSPEFVDGWADTLLDLLQVDRVGYKSFGACFERPHLADHDGRLTAHLRSAGPDVPFGEPFNGADLVRDALVADDVSVLYRAWLLARMARPQRPCETLSVAENEAHARRDFGASFFRSYLNRPVDCLGCHNSEFAVNDHPDPALDHHWPLEAHFEAALLGASSGPAAPDDAYVVFRHRAMEDGPDRFRPWGWDRACGQFSDLDGVTEDLLGETSSVFIDTLGADASPFTLERYLAQGVDDLAAGGLAPWGNGTVAGPEAFAYLVAANLADQVFSDVAGGRLTVAHGFPRTRAQKERLEALADVAAARFSLVDLLQAVATDPVFNLGSPASCDASPYGLPPLVEAWSEEEDDPVRRGNGSGDLVHRLPPRVLLRSVHDLLGWPMPGDFAPGEDVEALFLGVGAYRRAAEPGFRATDMSSLLALESGLRACAPPPNLTEPDAIDRLVAEAAGRTHEEVVLALKDRLLTDAVLRPGEAPLVEAVLGLPLSDPADGDPEALTAGLRALCSTWITSAPFQLRVDREAGHGVPAYDPLGEDVCDDVVAQMASVGATVSCP